MREFLVELSPEVKRRILIVIDFVALVCAAFGGFALSTGELLPPSPWVATWLALASSACGVATLWSRGFYRVVTRYCDRRIVPALVLGVAAGAVVLGTGLLLPDRDPLPQPGRVPVLFVVLGTIFVGGSRIYMRQYLGTSRGPGPIPVAIYGAGFAGTQLATALMAGREYRPVAFVDDDSVLWKTEILGLGVWSPARVDELCARYGVAQIILAIPSLGPRRRLQLLRRFDGLDVQLRSVPSLTDIAAGLARYDELRELEPWEVGVPTSESAVFGNSLLQVRGRNVLVTGAGSELGLEACCQLLADEPARLVLYETSEYGLYRAQRTLAAQVPAGERIEIVPLLGSVHNRERLCSALRKFEVHDVYHCALDRGLWFGTDSLFQYVENNVLGTWTAAQAAAAAEALSFSVLSVMRPAEPRVLQAERLLDYVVQAHAQWCPQGRFIGIRLPELLGSWEPLVDHIRSQVAQGGPVRLDAIQEARRFVRISNGVRLGLGAIAQARNGDVRTVEGATGISAKELAANIIRLQGLEVRELAHPDGDMEIRVGPSPGEVLTDSVARFPDKPVGSLSSVCLDSGRLQDCIRSLEKALHTDDVDLLARALSAALEPGSDVQHPAQLA